MSVKSLSFVFFSYSVLCLLSPVPCNPAFAHGTKYEIISSGVIGVKAMFDTGIPMSDAPVLIFRPEETEPAFEQKTDKQGRVFFAPDRSGTWILQVRDSSGHGMRVNIKITEEMTLAEHTAGSHSLTMLQKIIMAVCVLWGFAGTALFFRKSKVKDI